MRSSLIFGSWQSLLIASSDRAYTMSGASSVFRMGDGVMDKWKVFRRKSCEFAALVLKIDSDNEQVVVSHRK